jgi:hypothetical protein
LTPIGKVQVKTNLFVLCACLFRYENLILVAGGIGISPFLAILSDIIHRIEQGMPCAPKNVLVLWSVKKSTELSLLSAVDAQSICSSVSDRLHLDIQAFVTQESEPPLVRTSTPVLIIQTSSYCLPFFHQKQLHALVGNNIWLLHFNDSMAMAI